MSNQKIKNHSTRYLLLTTLFIVAFLERTVFDLGPNVELVTTAMILSAFYFGRNESFWLTFAIIAISDRIIGNSSIFLFTWTGFLIPAFFASTTVKFFEEKAAKLFRKRHNLLPKLMFLTGVGISSNIFFYLWTNFGVWFLDSFNMYPDTVNGLIMSYINGLPFLKYQLVSTLTLLPSTFLAITAVKQLSKRSILVRNIAGLQYYSKLVLRSR